MPRKQWGPFEKVNSADVNSFLADQSVMTFATTAARDAAIPTPTTGMQSAVQASPDLGAPRYWNGSTWVLVQNGAAVAAVTSQLNATTLRSISITSGFNGASTAWQEVTASLGFDALIYGVVQTSAGAGYVDFQIGTGASGSEVVRFHDSAVSPAGGTQTLSLVQPGVFVPSGTRLAIRVWNAGNPRIILSTGLTGGQSQAGCVPAFATGTYVISSVTAGAWAQVDSTPPLAGGCWVTGIYWSQIDSVGWSLGLGGSGSEVVVSSQLGDVAGSVDGTGTSPVAMPIGPFFWTASTRLAIRNDGASTRQARFKLTWRESLT